ncbi:hypothetical protein ACWEGQ_07520 [Streptomyces seoulensis]
MFVDTAWNTTERAASEDLAHAHPTRDEETECRCGQAGHLRRDSTEPQQQHSHRPTQR